MGARLSWLQDAPIRDRYLQQCGDGDPGAAVERCGLPMNRPQTFGPFISQRFQRIAFQHWLVDGPAGIRAGDVTPILGGDLLKASGVLAGLPVRPHARAEPPAVAINPFVTVASAAPALPGPPVDFRDRATLGIILRQVDMAEREAPAEFRPGAQGQDLVVGDRVRTDTTGNALVTYFEGTTAEVSPSSVVTVERISTGQDGQAQNLTLQQLAGEVVYRLTRALRPGATVEIRTPSAVATVRGTALRVTVGPGGETRIEVFSGKVEVAAGGDHHRALCRHLHGRPPRTAPHPRGPLHPPPLPAAHLPHRPARPRGGRKPRRQGTPGVGTAVPGMPTPPSATPTTPTPSPSPTLPPSATPTSRPSESSGSGDSGAGSSSTSTPTPTQTATPGEPTAPPTATATTEPAIAPSSTPTPDQHQRPLADRLPLANADRAHRARRAPPAPPRRPLTYRHAHSGEATRLRPCSVRGALSAASSYANSNRTVVSIPIGDRNRLEPASNFQPPQVFSPGDPDRPQRPGIRLLRGDRCGVRNLVLDGSPAGRRGRPALRRRDCS